jgi:ubiquinone/menaquinone biosynthesis C-methylase UbiE
MAEATGDIWKSAALTTTFLEGVRGAIPLAAEQIDVMLRLIAALGCPPGRILDLGCGDGVLAEAILRRFPEAAAVLLDFSRPMLDAAAKRLAGRAVELVECDYGNAAWTAAVAEHAPFDVVVSGYSIHHQPDDRKREIYAELFSLLAPGGLFLNVEHVSSASRWVEAVHDELFIDHLHRFHAGKGREEVAATYYHRPDKAANILAPVEVQCRWLRDIGFADVDCYLKAFELAVFGGRRPL